MNPTFAARKSLGPLLLGVLGLLAACVAPTQPLTLDHPASPAALEGLPPLEAGDSTDGTSGVGPTSTGAVSTRSVSEPTQQSASSPGPHSGARAHGGHAAGNETEQASGPSPDVNATTETPGDAGHAAHIEESAAEAHDHTSEPATPPDSAHLHGDAPPGEATSEAPGDGPHVAHSEESAAEGHDHTNEPAGDVPHAAHSESAAEDHDHTNQPAASDTADRHGEGRPDDSADSGTSDAAHDHGTAAPVAHNTAADELSLFERALPGLAASTNVHPAFVHFPIALWPAALLFWTLALVRPRDALFATARWLSYLALAGSLVTTATGLLAESSIGHDSPGHELVHVHKYFMLTTTGLGALTAVLAFLAGSRRDRAWRWAWGTGLVLTVTVMTFGADRGGLLVYGHGVGMTTSATSPQSNAHEHGSAPPGGHSGHGGDR